MSEIKHTFLHKHCVECIPKGFMFSSLIPTVRSGRWELNPMPVLRGVALEVIRIKKTISEWAH